MTAIKTSAVQTTMMPGRPVKIAASANSGIEIARTKIALEYIGPGGDKGDSLAITVKVL